MNSWLKVSLLGSTLLAAPAAMATTYSFETGPGHFGNGGSYDSISTSYNDWTNVLTWEVDNAVKNGQEMDGFWLVVNDGPDNPKGTDGLAIFYADFVDTDGAGTNDNIGLWAFEYNGQNNPNSYASTAYLGSFMSALVDTGTTRGFSLDVSGIYSMIAATQPYGAELGVWFHPTFGYQSRVDANGRLIDWSGGTQSWYDKANLQTTITTASVPEPATLGLVLLGAAGLMSARRRSK